MVCLATIVDDTKAQVGSANKKAISSATEVVNLETTKNAAHTEIDIGRQVEALAVTDIGRQYSAPSYEARSGGATSKTLNLATGKIDDAVRFQIAA